MAGNIIGEPIKKIIGKQVDLRQKIHGAGYNESSIQRSPAVLNFLNNKNAWIKLASGVSLDNGKRLKALSEAETSNYFTENDIAALTGKNLAKNYILFNTMQSLIKGDDVNPTIYETRRGIRTTNSWSGSNNKMYGGMGGNSRGLQPVPGITGIKVESINRGSIRKATVTLKAFNKFQFGIIEILYLKLGYLMMLEWGWDKYIDSIDENNNPIIKNVESTIIENQWFKDGYVSQLDMLQNIESFVNRYKGNYQGFFGKVNNFSWTLNADNTYDITINLITIGSVIESINAVVPSSPLTTKEIKERTSALKEFYKIKTENKESEEGQGDNKVITNLGSDRISSFIAQKILSFFNTENNFENDKDYYDFENVILPQSDSSANSLNASENNKAKIPPNSRYYIRFEKLLNVIEDNVILKIKSSDPNNPPEPTITFEKSLESTIINYEPNLIPLDPSICIFKPVYTEELGITKTINLPSFSGLEDFVVEKDNVYYGKLMNVYLNLDYVSTVLNTNKNEKNELNLYDFIQKLLDGINRCMGNIPDLSVSIKNDRVIYFLDENPITGYNFVYPPKSKEVEFNVIGYTPTKGSTFVTDFNFQTKITPKLMTQISIGATANGTAVGYQNWNQGLTNRFENEYDDSEPKEIPLTPEQKTNKYLDDLYERFKKESYENYLGNTYTWEYKGISLNYGTEFTNTDIFGNSDEENFNDDALKDLVFANIKAIDAYIVNKLEIEAGDNITDKGLNDYANYLLDGFGGTGTNNVQVRIPRDTTDNTKDINDEYALKKKIEAGTATIDDRFAFNYKFVKNEVSAADALYWSVTTTPEFLERGYNSFKRYKSSLDKIQYENESIVTGTTGFIPVTLGLTFEGLGGIKIYNQIKVNQNSLPASYPKALQFVVDGVNHEVNGNLWKTNITTISRPNTTQPIKRKISKTSAIEVTPPSLKTGWDGPAEQALSLIKNRSLIAKNGSKNGLIYYPEETNKIQVVLHHTADNAPVINTINYWTSLSQNVSTHFIINRDGDYDQLFPLKYWANHLGRTPSGTSYLQKTSISIELEGRGFLKYQTFSGKNTDGTFKDTSEFKQGNRTFTYKELQQGINEKAVAKPVKMLANGNLVEGYDYRGYEYYQAYTTPQLNTLKKVLQQIRNEYPNIPIGSTYDGSGTKFSQQFPDQGSLSTTVFNPVPGTFTHNSYRTDKRDIFPQKELIELLQEFS